MSDRDERELSPQSTENAEYAEEDLDLEEQAASEVKGGRAGGPMQSPNPLYLRPHTVASTLTGGVDESAGPG